MIWPIIYRPSAELGSFVQPAEQRRQLRQFVHLISPSLFADFKRLSDSFPYAYFVDFPRRLRELLWPGVSLAFFSGQTCRAGTTGQCVAPRFYVTGMLDGSALVLLFSL